jgi:hypothetical protein
MIRGGTFWTMKLVTVPYLCITVLTPSETCKNPVTLFPWGSILYHSDWWRSHSVYLIVFVDQIYKDLWGQFCTTFDLKFNSKMVKIVTIVCTHVSWEKRLDWCLAVTLVIKKLINEHGINVNTYAISYLHKGFRLTVILYNKKVVKLRKDDNYR